VKARRRILRDDAGASAVEYGLVLAAVAAVTVIVIFAFGGVVQDVFSGSCSKIDGAVASTTAQCNP
jgi:pilus assembly protein Flp/PilA